MDDSRNSVTSGARGERTLIGAPRPAPRATDHFTHRPCYESPPATRRPRRVALAWAALALLGLLATVAPEQAVAQTEITLVGNAGQPNSERHTASFQGAVDHAQQFATGSNTYGYTLTKVEFLSNDAQSHTFSAQFCEANNTGGDDVPDPMNCQTLSTTSSFAQSSVVVFTPPAGKTITLAASTRYVVVLSENNNPSAEVAILSTQANNQNGATGWTLTNVFDWKQNGTTWMKQGMGRDALIMDVKGYVNTSLPAAVSDVVVVPVRRTTDSLRISWSAPDNTGKPALTGYEFRYKPTIGGTWTLVSHPGASTSVTVNSLEANGYYLVEVRALNADGSGPWSVTAESQTTPLPETVLANHPLIPDDLGPGDSFRLLHVTSGTTAATGTLIPRYHDTAAADVFPLVASGGLLGRWFEGVRLRQRALVSTAGADARLYTDTTWTSTDLGVPIYWINGARVADDYQDFYDGIWADEANPMNGFGEPRSLAGTAPWTGTDHDGTELFNGTASRAMGQASVSVGGPGSTIPGAGPLNGGVIFASTEERPVYGLWHVIVIDENLRLAGNLTLASTATEGTDERAAVRAQLFTTGPNPGGYGISYIYHWRGSEDPADASLGAVGLYTTDGDGDPDLVDGLHATLSLELTDSRSWTLEAPVGTVLKASTTYALVFQGADPAYPKLNTTVVDGEDVVAAGWSLADVLRYHDGSNWVDNPDGFALSMDIIGPLVDVPAPGAPTTLTATASGTTQINLSWTAPTDTGGSPITGYKIESSPDGTNWTTLEANTNGPATTYAHTGLAAGTTRYYRVSAINTNGAGAPSNVDGATTGTTVPGAPTGLQATASGNTQIDLSWTAPGNTGGSPITGYRIEESPDGNSNWTTLEANTNGPATTYAHTGLAAGTTRHYRVSAINSNGVGAPSNVDGATTGTTVPGAPTSLVATASGNTRINLSWTAPASDGGSPITGYKIEVSPDGNSSWTTLEANTNGPATTYAHTGLAAGTTRYYRVSAINTNGAGAPSSVDDATTGTTVPGAPTGLQATASGTTRINLSWTAPGNTGGRPITGYRIEESPDGNSSWTTLEADTNGPATTYSRTGLSGGATRHYRVSAINSNGVGAPSNVDGATTGTSVPDAPTSLTATASGTTRINLSWTAPASDGGSPITGYRIEESPDGNSSWTTLEADTTSTRTTYPHAGLSGGATRHYRVSAINSNGAGAPSNVDGATTGTSVPDAPTVLTATASGTTRINLSWTAPGSDGGSPIIGYRIESSPNGRSSWTVLVATTGGAGTTHSDTGLPGGATRHYRVSAINSNGAGAPSNVAGTTTGTSVPGAPTSLTATASGTARINLSWTAPARDGGTRITGYRIEESPDGTSSWTDLVTDTTDTRTTYSHTGLSGGATRHYRVSAINSNGAGAPSSVDSATTGTSVPGAPTALSARASGTTQVDLSWTAPASDGGSPVTGYRIEESPNGNSSWTDLVANTRSPHRAYSRAGLPSGATRHYRVSAVNTNGAGAPSNTASTTTGTTVPGAPTSLTAAASGTTRINLSWTAPASDGGIRITGYRIESSLGSGSSWTDVVANTGITRTTYSDTGLSGGATRYYRVSAINTNGAGAHSNVDGATTGTTVPDAPTDLTARVSENIRINLSWARPASDGGSLVTGYRIEISSDGGSSWTDRVANTRSPHRAYSHTVNAGATRHYRVSAISAIGASAHSNVASATTVLRTVRFADDLYTAREGGAAATVAVVLSAAAPAAVTIPLTREHLSGATEADYSGVPAGVTFAAGQARQTFTVTVTEDSDEDGLKRLRLQFGRLPSGYASRPPRTAVVKLVDNDGGLVVDFGTESSHIVQVIESTANHRFLLLLNKPAPRSLTIPLAVTHVGGATDDDYEGLPASVTFAAGQSQASFSIRAIPDGERESGEGLRIDFGPLPSGVARGEWGPYETIEFVDQVLPEYTARFGAAEYTATEGGAPARVSIHLNEPVEIEPLEVRLSVQRGGGATGADYAGIPARVTFDVGERTQTITVTATNDTDDDDGESVTLSLVNDPNDRVTTGNGPNSATVALADNDGAERVTVSFGAATHTATEGGSAATVHVELDAAPGRSVTVPLRTTDIGGATGADYSGIPSSVTFAANQTATMFTVTAMTGDGIDGGESVSIGFGTLPDGVFAGRPAATTVTLADGGEQTLVVEFDTSWSHTVQVREGGRRKRLRVLLNQSARRPVTIPLVVQHVGGATEADYAALPESVTIAAGQSEAAYYVQALPDEEDETGEGLRLDFGPLPPGVRKGIWGPYETIDFLDPAPAANVSVSGTVVTVGYPGALDRGSTPSPRDFVVSAEAPGGDKAMAPVAAVAVHGSDVFLQLARPVLPDDTVTLNYLADAMHPVRDAAGVPVAPLRDAPVRNDTPASGLGPETGLPVQAAMPVLPEGASVGAWTQRLDLSSRNLTDITALAGLTGLRELDLRHNAVSDLWPLAGLTGLKVLYLSGNRIADLRPLAGLTGLEVLDLSGNRISDLWPLAGLTGLRELDLRQNAVSDLWPLAGLTGLEALDVAGNRIVDLWGPSYLTSLERLNLADNAVEDLGPLERLTGLRVLLLDRNRITGVLALSPMAGLGNLGLAGNPIADLWPLAGLGQLHRLDLAGSAVADLTALGRLGNLRWLWLDPTPELEALTPPAGRVAPPQWTEPTPGIEGDGPGPQRAAPGHKRRFE